MARALLRQEATTVESVTMSTTPAPIRPAVLLVDGEPEAGFELPRHAVPSRFEPKRVLATDMRALREAVRAGVAVVVIDGRESPLAALVVVEEVRMITKSGAPVPIVVVVATLASAVVLEQAPDVHVLTLPLDTKSLHARLEALADGRSMPPPSG